MSDMRRDVAVVAETLGQQWQARWERDPIGSTADASAAGGLALECAAEIRRLREIADRLATEKVHRLNERDSDRARLWELVDRWLREAGPYNDDEGHTLKRCARELEEAIGGMR